MPHFDPDIMREVLMRDVRVDRGEVTSKLMAHDECMVEATTQVCINFKRRLGRHLRHKGRWGRDAWG